MGENIKVLFHKRLLYVRLGVCALQVLDTNGFVKLFKISENMVGS